MSEDTALTLNSKILIWNLSLCLGFPGGSPVKNLPAMQETWVPSLGWEAPLGRGWQPTPVFLPGESHGQRSLAGYSPQRHKGSAATEHSTALVFIAHSPSSFCSENFKLCSALKRLQRVA